MARTALILALGVTAAAAQASADNPDRERMGAAPPGTAETRYCMRIEAITGSRLERVRCWTRAEWAEREVDVDRDWPTEGVRTIG